MMGWRYWLSPSLPWLSERRQTRWLIEHGWTPIPLGPVEARKEREQ